MAKFGNSAAAGKTFLSVMKGKMVERLPDGVEKEGMVKRTLTAGKNEGKVVNELHYTYVEGKITNVSIKKGDFGDQVLISLDDNVVVQFNDRDLNQLVNTILNVDLSQPVNIGTYIDKDGYGRFSIRQNDELVPWHSTKDDPKGCPQAIKKTIKGETKWDFDEVNNWFYEKLVEFIKENFESMTAEEFAELVGDDVI